jgi:T-complex protein 1 subunit theta
MGDATNMVIMFAGELLKKSESLLVMGLHPSEVIKGYELALEKTLEELECAYPFHLPIPVLCRLIIHKSKALSTWKLPQPLTHASLMTALRPAIAAKQYGNEETLASLVADAALSIMPSNPKNFNVDNVRVVKIMGGSLASSRVVLGMVFGREPEGWYL